MEADFAKATPPKREFVMQKPVRLIASGDLMVNGRRALNHVEEDTNPVQDQ